MTKIDTIKIVIIALLLVTVVLLIYLYKKLKHKYKVSENKSKYNTIKQGMTESEVKFLLGSPDYESVDALGRKVYCYKTDKGNAKRITLNANAKQIVLIIDDETVIKYGEK